MTDLPVSAIVNGPIPIDNFQRMSGPQVPFGPDSATAIIEATEHRAILVPQDQTILIAPQRSQPRPQNLYLRNQHERLRQFRGI